MKTGLQTLIQMRYSFFGRSGWRSAVATDKALLFDPDRLAFRLSLMRRITLPSLAAQTDPDFRLLILTSDDLPTDHLRALTETCHEFLGDDRVHLIPHIPTRPGWVFRKYIVENLNTHSHIAQVVLDDDDALACDFVAMNKHEAEFALSYMQGGDPARFISYATGISAAFAPDGIRLSHRTVPFTNLGLTLVTRTETDFNPYQVAHQKVARRFPVRVNYDQRPFYIRAVHDHNDSKGRLSDDPVLHADLPRMRKYFPLLDDLDLIWDDQRPESIKDNAKDNRKGPGHG